MTAVRMAAAPGDIAITRSDGLLGAHRCPVRRSVWWR